MSRLTRLLAGAAILLPVLGGAAQTDAAGWLSEAEMTAAFKGQSLDGTYTSGITFSETYTLDGRALYSDPKQQVEGRWHITSQGFCTFYDDMAGGCFRARAVGTNCYEFYLVESQTDGPLDNSEPPPYVALAWHAGRPSTCPDLSV